MEIQLEREKILNARYRRAQKARGYRRLRLERQLQRDAYAMATLEELRNDPRVQS